MTAPDLDRAVIMERLRVVHAAAVAVDECILADPTRPSPVRRVIKQRRLAQLIEHPEVRASTVMVIDWWVWHGFTFGHTLPRLPDSTGNEPMRRAHVLVRRLWDMACEGEDHAVALEVTRVLCEPLTEDERRELFIAAGQVMLAAFDRCRVSAADAVKLIVLLPEILPDEVPLSMADALMHSAILTRTSSAAVIAKSWRCFFHHFESTADKRGRDIDGRTVLDVLAATVARLAQLLARVKDFEGAELPDTFPPGAAHRRKWAAAMAWGLVRAERLFDAQSREDLMALIGSGRDEGVIRQQYQMVLSVMAVELLANLDTFLVAEMPALSAVPA